MRRQLLTLLTGLMLSCAASYAQNYDVSIKDASLTQAIDILSHTTGCDFIYQKGLIKPDGKKVNIVCRNSSLSELLDNVVVRQLGLSYRIVNNSIVLGNQKKSNSSRNIAVHGVITDPNGEPLPGVTVTIAKTKIATTSDAKGCFALAAPDGSTISFSYVGAEPYSTKVTKGGRYNIVLRESANNLSEIVVTGYQELKKEKMTGSVATISSEKLNNRYTPNLIDNLEGRIAGLSTYGGKMVIRGEGTLRAGTTPLLVVDGIPVEGGLDNLNPYDIESINVLKDAAASAIYGARASNGIIVVTTKSAKKKGKIDVSFSANLTCYENKNMDYHDNFYMTPAEHIKAECDYMEYKYFTTDYYSNGSVRNNPAQQIMKTDMYTAIGYLNPSPIDWAYYQLAIGAIDRNELDKRIDALRGNNYAQQYADAMYRRQVLQQYNLALRHASDRSRNSVVFNYKTDNVGIINQSADWANISYKGAYDLASWLTANMSINTIFSSNKTAGSDYNSYAQNPWAYAPYYSFYNTDGTRARHYSWYSGNAIAPVNPAFHDLSEDPVEEAYNNTLTTNSQALRYHGDLLFKILPGLTANSQFIYETTLTNSSWHATEKSHASRTLRNAFTVKDASGAYIYKTPSSGGFLQTTETTNRHWTARGQLNYSATFGKHYISAIAGLEFRETKYDGTKALALGYDEQLQSSATHTVDFGTLSLMSTNPYYMEAIGGYPSLQFAFNPYLKDGMGLISEVRHRYGSGYANATYTYAERYNVFGSFRKDYADMFGLNAKFRGKPLWSLGAGWNIHNEEFAHEFSAWLNFLKLRVSYGVTGNIYQGATSVMTATAGQINSSTTQPNGTVTSPANPDLRWEQNRTVNVGIDYNLFNFRLRGSLDFYNKEGKDIFNSLNLDPTVGFTSMVANAASIRNTGFETVIAYDWMVPADPNGFGWTTTMTFTYNRNRVTEVENPATTASQMWSTPYKVGYPVNAIWALRYAGISDIEGEEGRTLFYVEDNQKSTSASAKSTDILVFAGQKDPKCIVGIDNTLRWRGFSLGIVAAYYGGHKMIAKPYRETFSDAFTSPVASYFNNAWTPENKTDFPGIGRYASTILSSETSHVDRSVYDAAFIKIRNIVLGYTIPDAWLKRYGVNTFTLSFQFNNPKAIWTANSLGVDPETLGIRNPGSCMLGINFNL